MPVSSLPRMELLQQYHNRSEELDEKKFQLDMFKKDTARMEEFLKDAGGTNAALLASKALKAGSKDDIAVISLDAAPGHVGFLSDGVGGHVTNNGDFHEKPAGNAAAATAQKAIEVATGEMLKDRGIKAARAETFDPLMMSDLSIRGVKPRVYGVEGMKHGK